MTDPINQPQDGFNLDKFRGAEDGLIRKMVSGGAILVAPLSADPITSLTDEKGQLKFQKGFTGLGRIARDGAPVFTPEDQEETTETWGEIEPSRRDVTLSTLTVEATLQDTNKANLMIAARRNFEFMEKIKAANNGEIAFEENSQPTTNYYQLLYVGIDGVDDDAFFFARYLPRAILKGGAENWNPQSEVTYPLTATATKDTKLGYSSKRFYGGPGAKKRLAAMGF